MQRILTLLTAASRLGGCMSTTQHREAVQADAGDNLTVGKVQREISVDKI